MTPYRTAHVVPAWLVRVDRYTPLRSFRWYRQRVGGVWVKLWANLLGGRDFSWWHSETLDPTVRTTCDVLEREIYL